MDGSPFEVSHMDRETSIVMGFDFLDNGAYMRALGVQYDCFESYLRQRSYEFANAFIVVVNDESLTSIN